MPLYENWEHVENRIQVRKAWRDAIVMGTDAVMEQIFRLIRSGSRPGAAVGRSRRPLLIAFDGWYGVDWSRIIESLRLAASRADAKIETLNIASVFQPVDAIAAAKRPYVTDDPGFGYVNAKGRIHDLMDKEKVRALRRRLEDLREGKASSGAAALIVYGSGAAIRELSDAFDWRYYFDMTNQPLLWKMWDGQLTPFGKTEPDRSYHWKEFLYCDFYLMHRQKKFAFQNMDFYAEAVKADNLKLAPREAYDGIIAEAVQYPMKQVRIYQPGPWGAYRYRDLWNIPGLECNAWNELAGPELSILLDLGEGKTLNVPTPNLMQHPEKLVGSYIHQKYPDLIPLQAWLDDGFFPTRQPAERTSMPIHNHPGTTYVQGHFNEPLGRYETYYIVEAYEGANTWMGYKEGADLELWEKKCRESERTKKPIRDWKDFICNWETNVGDLFLIPPGTTHGHGGNQMVLEMDTSPSVSGTEYSFFLYDFCRNTWDDEKKTMTAKPMKMHIEHGFDNDQWRREQWVKANMRSRPRVVKWTKDYSMDRYDSYGPMPFEIERFHFTQRAENDTQGKYMQIVTLTVGKKALIRSKAHPERVCELDRLQAAIVPACFGPYEIVNADAGPCTAVQLRWKKVE